MSTTAAVTLKPAEAELVLVFAKQAAETLVDASYVAEWKRMRLTPTDPRGGRWTSADARGIAGGPRGEGQDVRVMWHKLEAILDEARQTLGEAGRRDLRDLVIDLLVARSATVYSRGEEEAAAWDKVEAVYASIVDAVRELVAPFVREPRVRKAAAPAPVAEVLELPLEVEEAPARKLVAAAEPARQVVTATTKAPALNASSATRRLRAAGITVARARALTDWSAKNEDGSAGVVTAILVRLEYASTDADVAAAVAAAQAAGYAATMVDVDQLRLALPSTDVVELEAPEYDEEPTTVVEGGRYYAARAVHLGAASGRALCDASLVAAIDTTAAVTCGTCAEEAAGAAHRLEELLEGRRLVEAPALELPGVAAAAVASALGATVDEAPAAVDVEARTAARMAHLEELLPAAEWAQVEAGEAGVTLIVVPCSASKLDRPAPAGELYLGSFHTAARNTAAAIAERTPGARVVILSALYGLLELDQLVEPYNVTVGDRDAVDGARVASQLHHAGARRVVALTPNRYTELLAEAVVYTKHVGPLVELRTPLAGSRGIGEQRGRLAAIRRGELDPFA